jgi:hypothetical protein
VPLHDRDPEALLGGWDGEALARQLTVRRWMCGGSSPPREKLQRLPGVTHFRSPEIDHARITIAAMIGERSDAVAA